MIHQLIQLPIAALALFLAASDGYDGWEKTWRRKWLTPDQALVAKQRMNDALVGLQDVRKENLAIQQKLDNKFKTVEFRTSPIKQRMAPLCQLFTLKPVKRDEKVTIARRRTCSCFFVKPDIVMTDAHCIFPLTFEKTDQGQEKWVPVDVKPEDGFVTFVVRQYGVEGENAAAHSTTTMKHATEVVEWWTPNQFGYRRYDVDKERGLANMDVAFLKVSSPVSASEHFTLTQPEGPFGGEPGAVECNFFKSPSVMMLGYPGAYKDGEMALSVSGTVKLVNGAADEILFTGAMLGRNWWFTQGTIGHGGSGGPIVMGENSAGMPPKCDMGVFGICQGGSDEDDKLRHNYSPLITKQLIQALNLIEKVPIAPKCDAVTEGVNVIKKCGDSCACGVRTVELSLT